MSNYEPCASERAMATAIWAECLKVIAAHPPEEIAPKLGVKPLGLENLILKGTNTYNGMNLIEVVCAAEALSVDPVAALQDGDSR